MKTILLLQLFLVLALGAHCPTLIPFETAHTHGEIAFNYTNNAVNIYADASQFDYLCAGNQTIGLGNENGQLSIRVKGCRVLSLYCGWQDVNGTIPLTMNTLINPFSVLKTWLSMLLTILNDLGYFDWSDPVADYWPAFGQSGKSDITVEQLFSDAAALPYTCTLSMSDIAVDGNLTKLYNCIETQVPAYGSSTDLKDAVYGYSPIVYGYYVDSFIRSITGMSIKEAFEFYIGIPTNSSVYWGILPNDTATLSRVGEFRAGASYPWTTPSLLKLAYSLGDPNSLQFRAIFNPLELGLDTIGTINSNRNIWMPAGVGFTTAEDITRSYDPFAMNGNGPIVLASRAAIQHATATVSNKTDASAFYKIARARAGYWKNVERGFYSPSKKACGHVAVSSAVAFFDPDSKVSFAYLTLNYAGSSDDHIAAYSGWSLVNALWGWPDTM